MCSHLDALQAMGPVDFRRGPRDFHSVAKQASFYIYFGARFKDFGKPSGFPKSGFRGFFLLTLFFHRVWASNFNRFFQAPNQKNNYFPFRETMIFAKIVFDKSARIARFCLLFRRPKQRKSIQNSNPKTCCFEASNLKGFSFDFRCMLESKHHQNIANIRTKWCSRASSVALLL